MGRRWEGDAPVEQFARVQWFLASRRDAPGLGTQSPSSFSRSWKCRRTAVIGGEEPGEEAATGDSPWSSKLNEYGETARTGACSIGSLRRHSAGTRPISSSETSPSPAD